MSRRRTRLAGGVEYLREQRDGRGRWRRFPFYYTLLALAEIPGPRAADEIRYAAPVLERMLKRRGRGDKFQLRRRALAERALARV
ncbi:hypothetical protein ACFL2Z_05085 [Candidatus Eisenbacteria bacterium]|uniref:Uncharacterized protein n=1 Tax=Eiseniibacteriota bacterium TaxID=2212470 RepID=A0ABV6YQB3_UNCEI